MEERGVQVYNVLTTQASTLKERASPTEVEERGVTVNNNNNNNEL